MAEIDITKIKEIRKDYVKKFEALTLELAAKLPKGITIEHVIVNENWNHIGFNCGIKFKMPDINEE